MANLLTADCENLPETDKEAHVPLLQQILILPCAGKPVHVGSHRKHPPPQRGIYHNGDIIKHSVPGNNDFVS